MKHVKNSSFFVLLGVFLFLLLGCCSMINSFENKQIDLSIKTQSGRPISGFVAVERENNFFQKVVNPIGGFYHPRGPVTIEYIKGEGKLKSIREGDTLILYINTRFLPIQLEMRGKEGYLFTLDYDNVSALLQGYNHYRGIEYDKNCIVAVFEFNKQAIKLNHVEYSWISEDVERCNAMELRSESR